MGKKLNLTNGVSFGGKYTVTSDDVATDAVAEVITLEVTSGCTTAGDIEIVLRDADAVTIAVTTDADTASEVATLIQAGTYTGWTATVSDAIVTFTADTAEAKTGDNTLTVNSTGVVGTIEVGTEGVDAESGSITFDFTSKNRNEAVVDYDMAVAFTVLTDAGIFVPLVDAVITYPADGQVTLTDGASTFALTADYVITIVAQRSVEITEETV